MKNFKHLLPILFSTFFLFFITLLLPNTAQAQTTGTMSEAQTLGIDCSNQICLSGFNLNQYTYQAGKYVCNGHDSNGNCNQLYTPQIYVGQDIVSVLMASINTMISATSSNSTNKIKGSDDCWYVQHDPDIYDCYLVTSTYDVQNNRWVDDPHGSTAGASSFRNPTTCPNGASTYIPGQGCMMSGNYNGVAYNTQRPPKSEPSHCDICEKLAQATAQVSAKPVVGNPVDINTGAKIETHTDIDFPIPFRRTYSSLRTNYSTLGGGWKHDFDESLSFTSATISGNSVVVALTFKLENDEEVYFTRPDGTSNFTVLMGDQKGYSFTQSGGNYILKTPSGSKEIFNSNGQYITRIDRSGMTYSLAYNSQGQLSTITDSYGHTLNLIYSPYANAIIQVNSSNGDYVQYTYNNGQITQAKFDNVETVGYVYSGMYLTNKIDALGNTYSTYQYDGQGRTIDEVHNTSATTTDSHFHYSYGNDNTVTMTLPDGATSTYTLSSILYQNKTSSSSIANGKNTNSMSFDSQGNITGYSDGVNNNSYSYDSNTNLLTHSNYSGTTHDYTWDTNNFLVLTDTESAGNSSRVYSYGYDNFGNLTQKQLTASGQTRTWHYTYSTYGKIWTIQEPTGSTTTYTYYDDNYSDPNLRGLIHTITNGVGQTLTITSYNSQGMPLSMTLPNGLVKSMTYDYRGRVLSETLSGATNNYNYDAEGDLLQASFANGYVLNMTYDMDHRLVSISDNINNTVNYTLDVNGNPTNESEYTGSGLVSTKNRVFDSLSRMTQFSRSSGNYAYNYSYDAGNRVSGMTTPTNDTQSYGYDPKGNVTSTAGMGRSQSMNRDTDGNITSWNQQGNNTNFSYNDFDEMTSMTSPDSGSHTYSYDPSSNTATHTDNASTTQTVNYDGIGRVTHVSTGGQNETYTWDTLSSGKLSSFSDWSGSTVYGYDSNARLSSKTQHIGSFSKTVGYSYDGAGQMNQITYPSGTQVVYTYNHGAISGVSVGSTNILSSVSYRGFGDTPVSWTWGNGNARTLSLNQDERLTGLFDSSIINQSYAQDNYGNVTSSTDSANSNNSFSANYTSSLQLSSFNSIGYTPNGQFNIQNIAPYSSTASRLYYMFGSNNNKIYSMYLGDSNIYTAYDSKGNMTQDGFGGNYTYDNNNNMVSANTGNTYNYNALHQRVSKTVSGITTYFIYDENNLLLGEYDSSGNPIAEHVYLHGIPVAVIKSGTIYYVHTDYLGTPRAITNNSNSVVWRWDNTNPYGNNLPSVSTITYNLRFPGQYFDNETGLHYNIHRMYSPQLARYMQPDPIGVLGGMNDYSYTENNPLNAYDSDGLLLRHADGTLDFDLISRNIDWRRLYGLTNRVPYFDVYLYTDKGNKVKAYLYAGPIDKKYDFMADCHGVTFADHKFWINDDDVMQIIKDDGYKPVDPKYIKAGDIAFYRENGDPAHSLTVINTPNGLMENGKGGYTLQKDPTPLGKGWLPQVPGNVVTVTYYRKY